MCKVDRYHRQRIRDFNLISQKHWKRNRNLIHCSVTGKRRGGGDREDEEEGASARGRWRKRGSEGETSRGKIHFHSWLI